MEQLSEISGVESVGSLFVRAQISASTSDVSSAAPEMQFSTPEKLQAALDAERKRIRKQRTAISADSDGKIRVQERAMIPERIYELRLGDTTLQFVRRFNGPVVMYEIVDG